MLGFPSNRAIVEHEEEAERTPSVVGIRRMIGVAEADKCRRIVERFAMTRSKGNAKTFGGLDVSEKVFRRSAMFVAGSTEELRARAGKVRRRY